MCVCVIKISRFSDVHIIMRIVHVCCFHAVLLPECWHALVQ